MNAFGNSCPRSASMLRHALSLLLCAVAGPAALGQAVPAEEQAQEITISNVSVEQYGAFLRVAYDLDTSDGQPTPVTGLFSEDGGASFTRRMRTVAGDTGKDVAPGTGRWFVWNFHADGVTGLIDAGKVRLRGGYHPGMELEFGGVTFCWIPPGTYLRGRYPGEANSMGTEDPQHEVTLTKGFWLGKYEVTQAQWRDTMGELPQQVNWERGEGDNRPVYHVSWNDITQADGYLDLLNTAFPDNTFRLPTEAEWEYAYRADTTTRFYWGDDLDYAQIDDYAWNKGNTDDVRHSGAREAGRLLPNAWGLHDMSGNVREWCQDSYGAYPEGTVTDPVILSGTSRIYRGGAWSDGPSHHRAARRDQAGSILSTGFRLARNSDGLLSDHFADSPPLTFDAREAALAPLFEDAPYTAVSALGDGLAEAMRDLNGDGYPDAFRDNNGNSVPDAFEELDGEGRYRDFLDANDNTVPDWFETRYAQPIAKFLITDLDLETLTVSVRNVSTAGASGPESITGYQWDFGDGTVVDGFEPPDHTYATLENHTIALTLFWDGGDPVRWERNLLPGIQGAVIYVDPEKGRDEEGYGGHWQAPFRSLSHASNIAAARDDVEMVWARAGTYTETWGGGLRVRAGVALYGGFAGDETRLEDRDLSAGHVSTIDGENERRCITVEERAPGEPLVDGFTITNGVQGIRIVHSSPVFRNCIIDNNHVDAGGGGIVILGGSDTGFSYTPTFINCVISNNSALSPYETRTHQGGGIHAYGEALTLQMVNCVIADNVTDGSGGGISVTSAANMTMAFCTIANNTGEGIYTNVSSSNWGFGKPAPIQIFGSIMWGNSEGSIARGQQQSRQNEIHYSIVQGGYPGYEGNLDFDPLFRNPAIGDYALLPASPAIDAGWAPEIPATDIEGTPRPWGAGPDMGAYEHYALGELLLLDTPVERTLMHGQQVIFETPIGEETLDDIVAILTPLTEGVIFRLSSGGAQSLEADTGMSLITARANVQDGRIYHIVRAFNWANPETPCSFRILVSTPARYLAPLPQPITVSDRGTTTVNLWGSGFVPGMRVELHDGAGLPVAVFTPFFLSSNRLRVTLDVAGIPAQRAALAAVWPDEEVLSIADAVIISETGSGPRLETWIDVPSHMRAHRTYTVWFHYANKGDADLPAPLITVTSDDVRMRLSPDEPWQNGSIQFLGLNHESPVHLLPPGYTRSIPILINTWRYVPRVGFKYYCAEYKGDPIDWNDYSNSFRPPGIDAAEWNALWPLLETQLRGTWDGLFDALYHEADRFYELGMPTCALRDLVPPMARRAAGLPVAMIQGRVINGDTDAPVDGAIVKAFDTLDPETWAATTVTTASGGFVLQAFADGTYEIFIEGYYFDPAPIVDILQSADVTGLQLTAYPIPPEDAWEPEDPIIPEMNPVLVGDGTGNAFMLWERGNEMWWARWRNAAWDASDPIPEVLGRNAALAYHPDLLDGGGLMAMWETAIEEGEDSTKDLPLRNPTRLQWSRAVIAGNGLQWSVPVEATQDENDDIHPSLVLLPDTTPLAVWLQRNTAEHHDTEVYYDFIDLAKAVPWMPIPADDGAMVMAEKSTCANVRIAKGAHLPNLVPVFGGRYKFEVNAEFCGGSNCDGLELSGQLTVTLELSKNATGSGGGAGKAIWSLDSEACQYIFSSAQMGPVVGANGQILSPPIPVIIAGIPIGKAYFGGTVGGQLSGNVIWQSNFPGMPSGGNVALTVGAGPVGKIELLKGGVGAEASGVFSATATYTPPSELAFTSFCFTANAEVTVLWGVGKAKWTKSWGPGCGKRAKWTALGDSFVHIGDDLIIVEQYSVNKDGMPIHESLEIEREPFVGEPAIYGDGTPLTVDTHNDGIPALFKNGNSGHAMAVWAKDIDTSSSEHIGNRLYFAEYDGLTWSAPDLLDDTVAFNGNPAGLFLNGAAWVVWPYASSEGLSYESPIEDILAAADTQVDLAYAVRDGIGWSAPVLLATLPGVNDSPALAADETGRLAVVWTNMNDYAATVFVSVFDGAAWTSPEALSEGLWCDTPQVAAVEEGFLVVWSEDMDDDVSTSDDRVLRYVVGAPAGWSEPLALPTTTKQARTVNSLGTVVSLPWNTLPKFALPEPDPDCCEEDDDDLPPPPDEDDDGEGEGRLVIPADPNEKHGPAGLGDPESQRYISAGDRLDYVVFFENLPAATAPAQEVFVTDQLPPELDWSTFYLSEVSWGEVVHPVGQAGFEYSASVFVPDHRPEVYKLWRVDITFTMDVVTGLCQWVFRTIDPDTDDLPTDALAGFLPPNVPETGIGEGHIVFSLESRDDLPDATRIENQASIVFDTEAPIITNTTFNIMANPPTAGFSASQGEGQAPFTVEFINRSVFTPGSVTAYEWDFGDGVTAVSADPSHTYNEGGDYEVRLTVFTPLGDDTASMTISVTPPDDELVPVPNVAGMGRSEAEVELAAAGLTVGTVTEAFSSSVPRGAVISQTPEGGVQVASGSPVDLVVSKGPARSGRRGCGGGTLGSAPPPDTRGQAVTLLLTAGALSAMGLGRRPRRVSRPG